MEHLMRLSSQHLGVTHVAQLHPHFGLPDQLRGGLVGGNRLCLRRGYLGWVDMGPDRAEPMQRIEPLVEKEIHRMQRERHFVDRHSLLNQRDQPGFERVRLGRRRELALQKLQPNLTVRKDGSDRLPGGLPELTFPVDIDQIDLLRQAVDQLG